MMLKTIHFFIITLFFYSFYSFSSDYSDYESLGYHYEICNSCESVNQFKRVAMKETPNGKVVVANLDSGLVYAYEVETESEPGYEFHWAAPTNVPVKAQEATDTIVSWFNQMDQEAGKKIDRNNPFIPIQIPGSINGVETGDAQSVITNISSSDAVSNYLRHKTIKTLMDLLSAQFKMIVLKLNLTVTAKFIDGSTAEWILVNPLESKQPYRYVDGTAKDKNNNPINDIASGSAGWGGHISWSNYGSGGGTSYTSICKTYTIRYSFGGLGTGSVCLFTYIP